VTAPAAASPATRRRIGGARAKGSGDAWESFLQRHIFAPLITRGHVVRVDKLGPPCRTVWDSRRARAAMLPTGPGPADFWLLLPGGRSAIVEAKSTADERFYRDEIPAHQVKHLDQAAEAGAGAFLAVQFRAGPSSTAFLAPWRALEWTTARTAESVTAADLAAFGLNSWQDAARILGAKL